MKQQSSKTMVQPKEQKTEHHKGQDNTKYKESKRIFSPVDKNS